MEKISLALLEMREERQLKQTEIPGLSDRQVLEVDMKVNYDAETDILAVVLSDAPVAEGDEDKPGVILDYDDRENLVSVEVLDASARVQDPRSVTLSA